MGGPPPQMAGPPKNPGTAIVLEIICGGLFQVFGIGHFYAGNVGIGLAFLLGYWFIQAINAALTLIFIGFITLPLTWLIAVILAPISANAAAKKFNSSMGHGGY